MQIYFGIFDDDKYFSQMCISTPELLKIFLAGTISGEEIPVVSKANIKEYRDSFSCEKFNFRSNPNITFYVYVSNFSWPIKIQVSDCFVFLEMFLFQLYIEFHYFTHTKSIQIELFACCIFCV